MISLKKWGKTLPHLQIILTIKTMMPKTNKNIKKLHLVICFFCIFQFLSCNNKPSSIPAIEIKINLLDIVENQNISTIFSDINIIKLETTSESILGSFNKIVLCNDKLYFSTGEAILVFSESGKFLEKFQKLGKGPGEYSKISDIVIDTLNKQIEILCESMKKVLIYNMNFDFINEYSINRYSGRFAFVENSGRIFHCGNVVNRSEKRSDKMLLYKNGEKIEGFLKIDKLKSNYLHVIMPDCFSYYKGNVIFTDAHQDTVFTYDDMGFHAKYFINIGEKGIPQHYYEKPYRDIADFMLNNIAGKGYAYGVFGFIESDNNCVFRYDEMVMSKKSPFPEIKNYYIIHNKVTGENIVANNLCDDINFPGSPTIKNGTTFFSQPNGNVVFAVSAVDFLDMYKCDFQRSSYNLENLTTTKIAHEIKKFDNPIVFVAKVK